MSSVWHRINDRPGLLNKVAEYGIMLRPVPRWRKQATDEPTGEGPEGRYARRYQKRWLPTPAAKDRPAHCPEAETNRYEQD